MAVSVPIIAAVGGALVSSMLAPDAPSAPPPLPAPPVMPTVDDKAAEEARRRSILAQQARSGRASTILSDDSGDALGG